MSFSWSEVREESLAGMSSLGRFWFHLIRWLVLLAVALTTYLAFPATGSSDIPVYPLGAIATADVVAPANLVYWERVPQYLDPADGAGRTGTPILVVDSLRHVIRAGDLVVAQGETVSREQNLDLQALAGLIAAQSDPGGVLRSLVGPVLFNLLLLGPFWLILMFYRWETYRSLRDLVFFGMLFIGIVLLSGAINRAFPGRPELIPVPLAAILVTVLYNGRLGVTAAVFLAVLLGSQWALRNEDLLLVALVSGAAASVGTRAARRRKELYLTIATTASGYALAAVALGLLHGWNLPEMGWTTARGAVSAIGCASVAMLVLPLAESAIRVTTDITLLELSDPSHPLLRRLALEAPGTYAHSLAMANLCEAACNAIGANGLLARVGCYYHDIGKVLNPRFFVENQRPGANPHDQLTPRESAALVRAHVLDGVTLAREAGLPESIVSFIPEHHGTLSITYFLDRARKDGEAVNPADFQYPGPRPRSAETAIAMLADSTEAALRLLGNPTPERVRGAVEFLIQEKVDAGQLRDSPLTLSDLDRVKEEFVRVITSMRHNRVEYPGRIGGINAQFPEGASHSHA